MSWFDQSGYTVRLEWGAAGARGTVSATYAVVIDILSFSTTLTVALEAGCEPWPHHLRGGHHEFAIAHRLPLAARRSEGRSKGRLSLSPATWPPYARTEPGRTPVVVPPQILLPSGNGSTISFALLDRGTTTIGGCLRNRMAAVDWLAARLSQDRDATVLLVPAGERWPDRNLRPALEDQLGAGAIAAGLKSRGYSLSPEASAAAAIWHELGADVAANLRNCGSGRELIQRGYPDDVAIAAQVDSSTVVPLLQDGRYQDAQRSVDLTD